MRQISVIDYADVASVCWKVGWHKSSVPIDCASAIDWRHFEFIINRLGTEFSFTMTLFRTFTMPYSARCHLFKKYPWTISEYSNLQYSNNSNQNTPRDNTEQKVGCENAKGDFIPTKYTVKTTNHNQFDSIYTPPTKRRCVDCVKEPDRLTDDAKPSDRRISSDISANYIGKRNKPSASCVDSRSMSELDYADWSLSSCSGINNTNIYMWPILFLFVQHNSTGFDNFILIFFSARICYHANFPVDYVRFTQLNDSNKLVRLWRWNSCLDWVRIAFTN